MFGTLYLVVASGKDDVRMALVAGPPERSRDDPDSRDGFEEKLKLKLREGYGGPDRVKVVPLTTVEDLTWFTMTQVFDQDEANHGALVSRG